MGRGEASRLIFVIFLCACASICSEPPFVRAELEKPRICRPVLGVSPTIELGKAGLFSWSCMGGEKKGAGFYVVFIRPSRTYVLLKVPLGRSSFEFTPDAPGMWRWIVINTDPDRTKPDMESEPGYFQVIGTEQGSP